MKLSKKDHWKLVATTLIISVFIYPLLATKLSHLKCTRLRMVGELMKDYSQYFATVFTLLATIFLPKKDR